MSSITASANSERTNRWLLIGAAVLAIVAGVLIFAALANTGGSDGSSSTKSGPGDASVLVAKETIKPGTRLTRDMFERQSVAASALVPGAVSDDTAVDGLLTNAEVLKGQQLSGSQIGQAKNDARLEALAFKIPDGKIGMAISVKEESAVAGFVQPGDHVDVVATLHEKPAPGSDTEFVRISTVLQNIEVLARAQVDVPKVLTYDENGKPIIKTGNPDLERRATDAKADPGAHTVTLALTPEQSQRLKAMEDLGEITLALRAFGDDRVRQIDDVVLPVTKR